MDRIHSDRRNISHTFVKLTELQLEEIADTDIDKKRHHSRQKASDSFQHPVHYLQVDIGLY